MKRRVHALWNLKLMWSYPRISRKNIEQKWGRGRIKRRYGGWKGNEHTCWWAERKGEIVICIYIIYIYTFIKTRVPRGLSRDIHIHRYRNSVVDEYLLPFICHYKYARSWGPKNFSTLKLARCTIYSPPPLSFKNHAIHTFT